MSLRGLAPLLTYLRGLGAIPPGSPSPAAPGAAVLSAFERYLTEQRAWRR